MLPWKKWINAEVLNTIAVLDDEIWFPPLEDSLEDGLLAMGGDLRIERLIHAYQKGIFPWYAGDIPLWWSPDPRFVLFPEDLYVSKSMKKVLQREEFDFTQNRCFEAVIQHCAEVPRAGQSGTWITPEMLGAYVQFHKLGWAVSYEAWKNGELAGGFFGVKMGKIFFGESMFSLTANASKAVFIHGVRQMQAAGTVLIDCQTYSDHLATLGAKLMDRKSFVQILDAAIRQ